MHDRDWYPAGVPCWIDTAQPDPDAAAAFYRGLFGWEFEDVMPADAPTRYLVGRLGGRDVAAVTSSDSDGPSPPAWRTYVSVESADDVAASVRSAGGTALAEPFDVPGFGRMAVFGDPAGAAFSVWEPKQFHGARVVNEPGSWNFSELNTPEPDAAARFYDAVLGWTLSSFSADGQGMSYWRLPGYGDHLASRDPELRERQDADGAPEGFEDAVALLTPIGGDGQPASVPPHWSITFAVDDADATAARAADLGGEVVMAPFDAPYVRMTVLRDPQGAQFSASKYVPEGS